MSKQVQIDLELEDYKKLAELAEHELTDQPNARESDKIKEWLHKKAEEALGENGND